MFLKAEVVADKEGNAVKAVDCEKSENWLPSKNTEIGSGTLFAQNGYCMPVTPILTVKPPTLVETYVLIGNMFPQWQTLMDNRSMSI